MAKAIVSVAAATARSLPDVSVRSGRPADGFAPITVANHTIFLPLTQVEFQRVRTLQHRQRWSVWGGLGCLVFGAAMARFPLMLPLAIGIAILSALLWGLIWVTLKTYLPSMEVVGSQIRMVRVHDRFAAAVRDKS